MYCVCGKCTRLFLFLSRYLCHIWNVEKSRSTNNETRYIGDLYMFFMSCVSIGQCVNQTSGYWFIVFIVIWHICIQCTCTLLILQLMYFSSSCRIFKKIWSCGFFLCTLHRAYYMYCNAEVMDYVDKEITVLTSWLVFCGYFMNCMEQFFSHLFIDFSF